MTPKRALLVNVAVLMATFAMLAAMIVRSFTSPPPAPPPKPVLPHPPPVVPPEHLEPQTTPCARKAPRIESFLTPWQSRFFLQSFVPPPPPGIGLPTPVWSPPAEWRVGVNGQTFKVKLHSIDKARNVAVLYMDAMGEVQWAELLLPGKPKAGS